MNVVEIGYRLVVWAGTLIQLVGGGGVSSIDPVVVQTSPIPAVETEPAGSVDDSGFDSMGKHDLTHSFYGPDGFDRQGYDRQHYDREGYHRFTGRNRSLEYRGQVIRQSREEVTPQALRAAILELIRTKGKYHPPHPAYRYELVLDSELGSQDGSAGERTCQVCQESLSEGDLRCGAKGCTHGVHQGKCLAELVLFHLNRLGNERPITCDESETGHELKISKDDLQHAVTQLDPEANGQKMLEKLVDRWERTTLEAYFKHLGGRFDDGVARIDTRQIQESDGEMLKLLNDPKSNIRRCPYCRVPTQRTEACFHMRCQLCQSEWNWKYGRIAFRSANDKTLAPVTTFPSRTSDPAAQIEADARVYRTVGDADYVPGCDLECGYQKHSPNQDFSGQFLGSVVRQWRSDPGADPKIDSKYQPSENDGYLAGAENQL